MRMYLSAMLRASRTVYEGHGTVKDKQRHPLQEALLLTPGHDRHRLRGLGLKRTRRS